MEFNGQHLKQVYFQRGIPGLINLFSYFIFFGGGAHPAACRILVPRLGVQPVSPELEAQSLNHWTTREVPLISFNFGVILSEKYWLTISPGEINPSMAWIYKDWTGIQVRVLQIWQVFVTMVTK